MDQLYMRRCLQLAANGRQNAKPNPMVGAVIVAADGRIIGEGYHVRCGEGHAEVNAFASVRPEDEALLASATIYVSLEPCSHYGKTPPCADLIIKKGVRRCVVGCVDPFAAVQGRGIQKLRNAGIEVTVGVLEEECRELNRRFITFNEKRRPYIILKWAQTANAFLDDNGKVNENGGKYCGMDRYECRKAIVADLEAEGYLVKTEPYSHNVGTCYRCHNDVEPIISAQWFVKMAPLAKEAIRVVKDGTIKFVPERFSKIYINWMENVHDWCISRQLWWGHQIPAWYCDECGHINVSREDPTKCEKCGCTHLTRDEDVLDTWFSSALWPFSTLGWPDLNSEDLKYWYPTTDMVTVYDIIFFWVARMVFSGMEQMKKEPFKTVFIHGLVRDDKGRKMSKSLGNGIDPLEMAEKFGADALRFNLITGNSPGNDMRFYVEKCEAMRNFANKIWNASRYVLMNLTIDEPGLPALDQLEIEDKWVLSKLNTLIREVTENMDAYELGVASAKVYDFIWDTYCDWYIELTKTRLYSENEQSKLAAQHVLVYVLDQILRLLHPFMPFITEEIWQAIPHEGKFIMASDWPVWRDELAFPQDEESMELIKDAITAIRARRAEMNVPANKRVNMTISTQRQNVFTAGIPFFGRLAGAEGVTVSGTVDEGAMEREGMVEVVTHAARIFIPLAELVDFEKELARIAKEKENCLKQIAMFEGKLSNESFVSRAPEKVVNDQREKLAKAKALLEQLEESEKRLKK